MAYQKHNWVTREVIRREHLQNIEDGIYNEQERGEEAESTLDSKISGEISRAQSKETELLGLINGVDSDVEDEVNRATNKESDIEESLNAEITRAVEAESQLSDLISANNNAISTESSRAQNAESSLSTNISSEVSRATQAESDIRDYVDQKIATTYKPSGSIYFADLPALAESRLGNVYNIKDDFVTTADFVEGAGKSYPAGTNIAIEQIEELTYTEVEPTGEESPSEEVWYELVNDEYVLSEDTEVDGTKTYYVRTDYALYYDIPSGFIDLSHYVEDTDYATTSKAGIVKPDGTTITVDADGTLHGQAQGQGSGHTIVDSSGTELNQRSKLKFLNATVTDDATNDQTVVTPSGSQITVDQTVTQGSANPVSGGGVYDYIDTMITQAISASY